MAELLNDVEIRRILGTVIKDGVETSVRPNSYVLRLGSAGEFLTTGKEFSLGDEPGKKKGIKVSPGSQSRSPPVRGLTSRARRFRSTSRIVIFTPSSAQLQTFSGRASLHPRPKSTPVTRERSIGRLATHQVKSDASSMKNAYSV